MSLSIAYEGSRSQLIRQLIYFDEEKSGFLNQYFPEWGQKRSSFERFLSDYSAALERILADLTPENLHAAVLIGSQLDLRYIDDGATETFAIVFPHMADPDRNRVSFLSPLGYQLMLAKAGDRSQLEVPSGEITVQVDRIQFVNLGDTP